MNMDIVRAGDFDIATWAQSLPADNPVDEYIKGLKRQSSKVTMLQALSVMASIYEGEGRPDMDRNAPPAVRKDVAAALKEYARNYDWFSIDDRATQTMLAELQTLGYAKSSQGKMIAAVVGVLQRCMRIVRRHDRETRQRLIAQWQGTREQLADAMKMMDAIVGMRYSATQSALDELSDYEPVGPARDENTPSRADKEPLSEDEVEALFKACEKQGGALGVRNQVILALGFGCGLRRSEIAKLRYEDVIWKGEKVDVIRDGKKVGEDVYLPINILDAKGDKDRLVSAGNGTRQSLLQWRAVRGTAKGPLLLSFDRWSGKQEGMPIDGQTVYTVLADLAAIANKTRAEDAQISLAPHDMRRCFVSSFIDATGDISMASKLAGHASVTTTQGYDRRGKKAQAAATLKAVHVPSQTIIVQTELKDAGSEEQAGA